MIDEKDKKIFELETEISKLKTQLFEAQQRFKDYKESLVFLKCEHQELIDFLKKHHSQALSHYHHEQELKLSGSEDEDNC